MSGVALIPNVGILFGEAFSNLKSILTDGTSGPTALHSFLRAIKLHYLDEVSSSNLAKQIRRFEIEVDTPFSIYFIRLLLS